MSDSSTPMPARPVPVRLSTERFRGRRITSPSFVRGFHATIRRGDQSFRGTVLDVSAAGVGLTPAPSKLDWPEISARVDLTLDYFGERLYRGPASLRHLKQEGVGGRAGFELHGAVDLSLLHRHTDRLGWRHEWRQLLSRASSKNATNFQAWVLELRDELESVRAFLDERDTEMAKDDVDVRRARQQGLLEEIRPNIVSRMHRYRRQLDQFAEALSENEQLESRATFRRYLTPLLTQDPFLRRALEKPLGYAGDYELMNLLYREEPAGDSTFGRALHLHSQDEPAGRATINRRPYLSQRIARLVRSSSSRRVSITNVGCGAAQELHTFFSDSPELAAQTSFTLVDQDERALDHVERHLLPKASALGARLRVVGDPIQKLIDATDLGESLGEQELIYSAGLFDYLDDATLVGLIRSFGQALAPGGELIIGNMADHNPTRHWIEYACDWFLIHRSREDLLNLAQAALPEAASTWVDAEPEGVNLFLHVSM